MNEPHEFSREPDDPAIEAALAPLRSIEPTAAARAHNREAITAALEELKQPEFVRPAPWWRRSISIPVPVAACLLLIMSLLVVSSFQGKGEPLKSVPAAESAQPSEAPSDEPGESRQLVYRQTATYVCGIGELKSTRGYFFKEQDR